MRYFVYKDGGVLGPYSPEELEQAGPLHADTLVCAESASGRRDSDWTSLSDIAELSGIRTHNAALLLEEPLPGSEAGVLERLELDSIGVPTNEDVDGEIGKDWLDGLFEDPDFKKRWLGVVPDADDDPKVLEDAKRQISELSSRIVDLQRRIDELERGEGVRPAKPKSRLESLMASQGLAATPAPEAKAPEASAAPAAEEPAAEPAKGLRLKISKAAAPSLGLRVTVKPLKVIGAIPGATGFIEQPAAAEVKQAPVTPATPLPMPADAVGLPPSQPAPEMPALPSFGAPVPPAPTPAPVESPFSLPAAATLPPAPALTPAPAFTPAPAPTVEAALPPAPTLAPAPAPAFEPTPAPATLAPAPTIQPAPFTAPPATGLFAAPVAGGQPPMTMSFNAPPATFAGPPATEPPPIPSFGAPTAASSAAVTTEPQTKAPGTDTQNVLARLAKPAPQVTEVPKPARQGPPRKVLIAVGALVVTIVAGAFFYFLRSPKDLKTMVSMEPERPLGTEANNPFNQQTPAPQAPQAQPQPLVPAQQPPVQQAPVTPATPSPMPADAVGHPPSQPAVADQSEAALELVKQYPLDGDRGTVAAWLQFQFASNPGDGAREEWTAGGVDADTYLVQYRVVTAAGGAAGDGISYVFEADVKSGLVIGKSPQARALLSGSSAPVKPSKTKSQKKAAPTKRAAAKKRAPEGPRAVPLMPLPSDADLLPPAEDDATFRGDTVTPGQ